MNFVTLCTTTSAPCMAGERITGAKVLSTTSFAPAAWAISARAGISATSSVGLASDSTYKTFAAVWSSAAAIAAWSPKGTNLVSIPAFRGR